MQSVEPLLHPVAHHTGRKALIIGGGIGGLATAIALKQIGLTVEVYERVTTLREVGPACRCGQMP